MKKESISGPMEALSSHGLTCILLVLLFALTYFGTIEQVEHGLHPTQKKYFDSWFLVHQLGRLPLPLPGGVLVMSVLALNMLCGGLIRIRKARGTVGVIVVHVGIALMLAAGLVKRQMAEEGHLTLYEGEQSDDFQSYYLWEVVIWDAAETSEVLEHLIPDGEIADLLDGRERTFISDALPFELTLSHFQRNCRVMPKGPMWESDGPAIDGYGRKALPPAVEAEHNIAGLVARLRTDEGVQHEGLLWGIELAPFTFDAGGRTWAITLRHKRYRMPFTIRLDDFVKEDHPRMNLPKAFRSDVTKFQDGGEQNIRIQMNEPLRHGGLALFQANWGPGDARPGDRLYSGIAVVRNPSDHWPLYSCIVIGVGLLIAFGSKLRGYVKSHARGRDAGAQEVRA